MRREVANAFGKVFLTMEHEPANQLIHNRWQGYLTLDNVKRGGNESISLITEFSCAHLLNDNTAVTGPWDHAVAWIAEDWTPRAIAAGLTHFAHVVDAKSFAALSAEAMSVGIAGLFEMRIFGNAEAARAWLKSQGKRA